MLFLRCSSTYSPHINHSGQDSLTKISFRAPIFRSGLEARSNKNSNTNLVSTECRLQTGLKCRLGTRCSLQTADRVQNCRLRICTVFRLIRDNMASYNLPSVTKSLSRDHLSRLFALLWNTPYLFLDHNRF